jgi:hypothetical protein
MSLKRVSLLQVQNRAHLLIGFKREVVEPSIQRLVMLSEIQVVCSRMQLKTEKASSLEQVVGPEERLGKSESLKFETTVMLQRLHQKSNIQVFPADRALETGLGLPKNLTP